MANKNKREIKDAAAADLARRAEEILRQNPSGLSERMKNVATPAEILEAVANLRIHEIELDMQNEELRRAQMQLTASNIRYFDLYDLAPVGYITVSENGQILRANLTATSQLGMARDQLTTQRFSRFILKEDQGIFYFLRRQLIKTREPQTCELRMLNKDGSPFWAKLEASAELAEAGEKQEIILRIVLVDISELKDKEQELRDSHWRMESIIEGTQLGTWEWNIQTGETVFNEQWAQTIGYTLEELAPISIKTWEKFSHPDDLQQSDELLKRYFAGELPTYYSESRMRHKDGRWVWVLDRGRVFTLSADGKPLMMFGTHSDITERKLAEEVLFESNERFRNMFEKNSAVMLLIDPHTGAILDANRSAESFYGYDKQKLITMSINDLNTLSPDQIAIERQKALTREKNYFIFSHKLASGEKRAVEVHSTPIIFQDKQILFSIIHDITERKLAEEALRESEEKYRTVADFTHDWEAWRGPDNTYLYVSPSCERISGHTAAEFLADPDLIVQITHPDDKSIVMAHYKSTANQSERADLEFDFRIHTPDGETRWIAHSCTAVYAADGKWLGRRESNREITEKKREEELLAVSESRYRRLFEAAQDGILILDAETGKIMDVNPFLIHLLGFSRDQFLGKYIWDIGFEVDTIGNLEKFQKLQQQQYVRYENLTLETAQGRKIHVEFISNVYFVDDKKVIQCNIRDVSDRVENEERILRLNIELDELANLDGLTGINNHRSLLKLAEREFDVAMRYKPPLSMMFFDIDNFKQINDTFGHAVGDEALKNTIQAVCGKLRSADQIGRYGGDEFVILLPQTSAQDALPLAERIHASIAAMRLDTDRGALTLTISIGIAQSIHDALQADTVEALLHRSDIALYAAKQAGKNCTRIHDEATLMKE